MKSSVVIVLLHFVVNCAAWTTQFSKGANADNIAETRRGFLCTAGILGTSILSSEPAYAAQSQEDKDKANLVKGYERLTYLLNNWEKETTVCKVGQENFGGQCERTPLKVMDYLGFRSTTDPLFKADKAMMRLYNEVDFPKAKDSTFVEAMELYTEVSEEASGMAYISSWGEANPGGGKDRVELFIERARKNVITSRDSLDTVLKILDVPH